MAGMLGDQLFEPVQAPCLICSKNKSHRLCDLELPLLPGCHGNIFVNHQLWSVFILKNLVKYPQNKITQLMENKGKFPSEWFLICGQCIKIVKEAMLVFQKILELEAEFETIEDEIKQKIEDSFKSPNMENVDMKEETHDDIDTVHIITMEIKKHFKGLLPVNSSMQGCSENPSENKMLIRPVSNMDELENKDFIGEQDDDDFEHSNPVDDTNTTQITNLRRTGKSKGRPKGTKKKYQCAHCNLKTFENKKALMKHHVQIHKKAEKLEKRRMKEEQALMSTFTCHLCPFQTKSQFILDNHIKRHGMYDDCKEVDGQLQCKYCDSLFPGSWALRRHIRKIHGNEAGFPIHKCPNCEKTFSQKYELNCHIASVHTQQFRFFCEICGYKTARKSALAIHMKNHGTEKSFICELCAAPFKTRRYLSTHKLKVHNNKAIKNGRQVQEFICKYCNCNDDANNKFLNKSLLNRHMQDVHKDLYIYKCDQCENSYLSVASLQLHLKINHSGKQGECQFCGVKVLSKVYLNAHYRTCKKKPADFNYK